MIYITLPAVLQTITTISDSFFINAHVGQKGRTMNSADNEIGKLYGLGVDVDAMREEQNRRIEEQKNLVQCPHCGLYYYLVPESIKLSLSEHIRLKHSGK